MEKPITLIYEELKNNLADIINNSGLPAFIIEPVLQNYLNEVKNIEKKQYEYDKKEYEESLEKEKNKLYEDVTTKNFDCDIE